MTVTFRCGHVLEMPSTATAVPRCGVCGERVVSRVTGATVRFTGACRGPYAETKAVEPDATPMFTNRMRLKEG